MPLAELYHLAGFFLGRRGGEDFSRALSELGHFPAVVPVGSGRAGFHLLLEALDFPEGSEIIFPAYTFHPMPAAAVEHLLRPVFADVDGKTWNIDPEKIAPLVNRRTRAIVPTHLFGVPAAMEAINVIAREHNLFVIEDCAHALGASCRDKMAGNFGDAAVFTFAMSKNLPCWGGGAVVSRDRELGKKLEGRLAGRTAPPPAAVIRHQAFNILALLATQPLIFPWSLYPALRIADLLGSDYFDRPFLEEVSAPGSADSAGREAAISPLQESVGIRQLRRFPGWLRRQVGNARRLRSALAECPGLQLQAEPAGAESSFLYVRARVEEPEKIRRRLLRAGIDTKPDDMRNCADLDIFGAHPACPAAQRLGGRCIELPCSHFYSRRQIDRIAGRIIEALK